MNREPVALSHLAPFIVAIVGRWGFDISIDEVLALWAVVGTITAVMARNRVYTQQSVDRLQGLK